MSEGHAKAPHGQRENNGRRNHHAVRPHDRQEPGRDRQNRPAPQYDMIDIVCDAEGGAALRQEESKRQVSQSQHQDGGQRGDCKTEEAAAQGNLIDPVPQVCTNILGRHRRQGGCQRHRRHLDISPQLGGARIGCGRDDAVGIDHDEEHEIGALHNDRFSAHRQAAFDQHCEQGRVRAQETQLFSVQGNRKVAVIDVSHHGNERNADANQVSERDPCDTEPWENSVSSEEKRSQQERQSNPDNRIPEWCA